MSWQPRTVAAASLAFTYLFFLEYLPPIRRVHIPFDLEEYHYPLADYAFQSLKHGRFPQWDPSMYCGYSFAGNIQAALFYPPTWLLFAANFQRERLSYAGMQDFLIAHVWLGFVLCYLWLRGKRLHELAAILGAGVFAYSGYVCLHLQHLGLVAGHAWFPLGLWGIDQAAGQRSWRPLWKLAAASALCFLAGYPPTWFVFAVSMGAYALCGPWHWKAAAGTIGALVLSLCVSMIQLLPAREAQQLMAPEPRYGSGVRDPDLFLSYLVPNLSSFGMDVPVLANPGKDCLYLGAPALLGLGLLWRRRNLRGVLPLVGMLAACTVGLTNPFGLVWEAIRHSDLLSTLCRSWYFFGGLTVAAAGLAAMGLDAFLTRSPTRQSSMGSFRISLFVLVAWPACELVRWFAGGAWLPSGWKAAFDPAITLAAAGFSLYVLRGLTGRPRTIATAAFLLAAGVDYKIFGTTKRLNAGWGNGAVFSSTSLPNIDPNVYRQMREHADFRLLIDRVGFLLETELRHIGLSTPQGYDPFVSDRYARLVRPFAEYQTDRFFTISPENDAALQMLGVRYVVTGKAGKFYPLLAGNPDFQLVGSDRLAFQVFEYNRAQPSYGWEKAGPDQQVRLLGWTPEHRAFAVRSAHAAKFTLHEQLFPGWTASIDGNNTPVELWNTAFQSIEVPGGEHTVEFRFNDPALVRGGWISLASAVLLGFWIFHALRRSPSRRENA